MSSSPASSTGGRCRRHPDLATDPGGLCSTRFSVILSVVMRHSSSRQLLRLLLAVIVAAGMGLSVAKTSAMAAQMAAMPMAAMMHDGDCPDCPDQPGDSAMKAMFCGTICATPVVAPLPTAAFAPVGEKSADATALHRPLHGRTLLPDPDPPRTSDIG